MKMPKVWYVPWIPGYAHGICLPPFGIFIEKNKQTSDLYYHEIGHWSQYEEWGLFKYYFTILKDYIKFGPIDAPVEYDATLRGYKFKRKR